MSTTHAMNEPYEQPKAEKVYLHPLPVRVWHWLNALGFLLLIITGFQLQRGRAAIVVGGEALEGRDRQEPTRLTSGELPHESRHPTSLMLSRLRHAREVLSQRGTEKHERQRG